MPVTWPPWVWVVDDEVGLGVTVVAALTLLDRHLHNNTHIIHKHTNTQIRRFTSDYHSAMGRGGETGLLSVCYGPPVWSGEGSLLFTGFSLHPWLLDSSSAYSEKGSPPPVLLPVCVVRAARTSLMLASRRLMSPHSSNSHCSLPCERHHCDTTPSYTPHYPTTLYTTPHMCIDNIYDRLCPTCPFSSTHSYSNLHHPFHSCYLRAPSIIDFCYFLFFYFF